MRYRHMYWLMFILYCMMGFLQYKWRENYYLAKNNQRLLINNIIIADSTIIDRDDTIKVLKFRLQTLRSND